MAPSAADNAMFTTTDSKLLAILMIAILVIWTAFVAVLWSDDSYVTVEGPGIDGVLEFHAQRVFVDDGGRTCVVDMEGGRHWFPSDVFVIEHAWSPDGELSEETMKLLENR